MNIEHPDITNTERTGYPNKPEEPMYHCEGCDHEIFDGDEYYKIDGEILCEDCVRARYRFTAGEE